MAGKRSTRSTILVSTNHSLIITEQQKCWTKALSAGFSSVQVAWITCCRCTRDCEDKIISRTPHIMRDAIFKHRAGLCRRLDFLGWLAVGEGGHGVDPGEGNVQRSETGHLILHARLHYCRPEVLGKPTGKGAVIEEEFILDDWRPGRGQIRAGDAWSHEYTLCRRSSALTAARSRLNGFSQTKVRSKSRFDRT